MVTPSGWHGDALKYNQPGHDDLQMAVYSWLCEQEFGGLRVVGHEGPRLLRQRVVLEFPMVRPRSRGRRVAAERIVAFADIAELFGYAGEDDFDRAVLLEIKPRILTIGGIVRQSLGYDVAFREAFPDKPPCKIFAVVPSDDPKFGDLQRVMPCLGWNTEAGKLEGNRFG